MKKGIWLAAALATVMAVSGCNVTHPDTGERQAGDAGRGGAMADPKAQLRQGMQGTGIRVEDVGDEIRLTMPGAIAFPMDASELASQIQPALDGVIDVLKAHPHTRVRIAGYTDATGTAADNRRLSERRARSVGRYLARGGIDPERLTMTGYGARHYLAGNDTPEGRAQNRRVTLTLVPTGNG